MATLADELWTDAAQPNHDALFGVTITYRRGGDAATTITAIPESIGYDAIDNQGMTTTATARRYSLAVADFPYDEPRPGDLIGETINGNVREFEVMAPAGKRAGRLLNGGSRWLFQTERIK